MRQIILLLACLGLTAATSHAASFDCAKAANSVEKMICGDPELSKADDRLADAYKRGMEATLYPAAVRAAQQQWLANRNKLTDIGQLRQTYKERTDALVEAARRWRKARRAVTAESARTTCVVSPDVLLDEQCTVDEFGPVAGAPALRYQLQYYKDGDLRTEGGVVIFSASGDQLTPMVVIAVETAHFGTPSIMAAPGAKLLVLPGHLEGTGNFNAEAVFTYDNGTLREVDTDSWLGELQMRLPKGWGAWKGIYPDYRTLTAQTPLWQSGDGNCCPTAGSASIRFRLQGQRLVIDQLEIAKGEAAASGEK